jgi:hydroxymethylpyrimidine/phosphomethylpyrimidine kinase
VAVTDVLEVPVEFVLAQLEAVFTDIGVDAAKTGMLFSAVIVECVASFLAAHRVPLVVDPVMVSSSGARLLQADAERALVRAVFPLATVVTPNLHEACVLAGVPYDERADRRRLAEAIVALGAPAAVVTGGHGAEPVDHLFDGARHVEIPVERVASGATHGAGCTHSASLCALLARGATLEEAARGAAAAASRAVRQGLAGLGAGDGPVDVLGVAARR